MNRIVNTRSNIYLTLATFLACPLVVALPVLLLALVTDSEAPVEDLFSAGTLVIGEGLFLVEDLFSAGGSVIAVIGEAIFWVGDAIF